MRHQFERSKLSLPFPFNIIPYVVLVLFVVIVGGYIFAGVLAVKAVNEAEANGGIGKAIGQFLGDVREGMGQ